jgi:hypothetical protein
VVLRDRAGKLLFATSTDMEESSLGSREKDEVVTVDFTFGAPFHPGEYGVEGTVSGDAGRLLGRTGEAITFEVFTEELAAGAVIQPPTRVEVHDGEELGPAT